jgi:hypothetical protein
VLRKDGPACPTFTASGTKVIYSPQKQRWLSAKEKLNSMLFPVYPETVAAAGVPYVMQLHMHEPPHTR